MDSVSSQASVPNEEGNQRATFDSVSSNLDALRGHGGCGEGGDGGSNMHSTDDLLADMRAGAELPAHDAAMNDAGGEMEGAGAAGSLAEPAFSAVTLAATSGEHASQDGRAASGDG